MQRSEYNHKNLTGPDADIEISLKEYGLAWIETETEYLFYYSINLDNTRFDFCTIDKGLDVFKEYDWADFNAVESSCDCDMKDVDLLQQIQNLLWHYGYENIFGSTYLVGLIYPQVVSGDADKIRLSDIENLNCFFSAEEIAEFAEPYDGVQNIKVINKFYHDQDESHTYPINNDYDVTERAIRRIREWDCTVYGLEYCYAIEAEISKLVNNNN